MGWRVRALSARRRREPNPNASPRPVKASLRSVIAPRGPFAHPVVVHGHEPMERRPGSWVRCLLARVMTDHRRRLHLSASRAFEGSTDSDRLQRTMGRAGVSPQSRGDQAVMELINLVVALAVIGLATYFVRHGDSAAGFRHVHSRPGGPSATPKNV